MDGQKCETCHFALQHDVDERQVYCRRNPPQHTMANVIVRKKGAEIETSTQWQFPLMFKDGWCGEYKLRVEAD